MSDANPINRLINGLFERNPAAARDAIFSGANVNAAEDGRTIPVWLDHARSSDYDVDNRNVLNEIFSLIIPQAKTTLQPHPYNPGRVMADEAWSLDNTEVSSLILLRAILQGEQDRKPYVLVLGSWFAMCGDGKDPYHKARVDIAGRLETLHGIVRGKLAEPGTAFEKLVAASLTAESRHFWCQPLKLPDLAKLPQPSLEFIKAFDEQFAAVKEYKGHVLSGQRNSEAARLARGDAAEAAGKIEELKQAGRASFVRPTGTATP